MRDDPNWREFHIRGPEIRVKLFCLCPVCATGYYVGQAHSCEIPGKGKTCTEALPEEELQP